MIDIDTDINMNIDIDISRYLDIFRNPGKVDDLTYILIYHICTQ